MYQLLFLQLIVATACIILSTSMVANSFVLVSPLASRLPGTKLTSSFLGFPVEEPMVETTEQPPLAASTRTTTIPNEPLVDEATWRFAKRPLLTISAKRGIATSHANSLRELLQAHTMVKVKVVSITSGAWDAQDIAKQGRQREEIVQRAMELMQAATELGAPSDLELLEARPGMRQVLIGLPGTRSRIEQGDFPPPPPPPRPLYMAMPDESGENERTTRTRRFRRSSPRERWSLKKKKERALENKPRPSRRRRSDNYNYNRNED